MKIGREVEGRFKGVKTLFCSVEEFRGGFGGISTELEEFKIGQIYISDHNNELDLEHDSYLICLTNSHIVTVECTQVSRHRHFNINIMLVIDSESFWRLGESDQVKFSKDLTVYSVTKENMTKTVPADFDGDISL